MLHEEAGAQIQLLEEGWDRAPDRLNMKDATPVAKRRALLSDWLPATTGDIIYAPTGGAHTQLL